MSSSSGIQAIFSLKLSLPLCLFQGYFFRSESEISIPVIKSEIGHVPFDESNSIIPERVVFSTGFPSKQPALLPNQPPRIRSSMNEGKKEGSVSTFIFYFFFFSFHFFFFF